MLSISNRPASLIVPRSTPPTLNLTLYSPAYSPTSTAQLPSWLDILLNSFPINYLINDKVKIVFPPDPSNKTY